MLSSRPHLALFLLLDLGGTQPGSTVGRCPSRALSVTCKLGLTHTDSNWTTDLEPNAASAYMIWKRPWLPINHDTASSYLHMCMLFKESLIDGSVKRQCATITPKKKWNYNQKWFLICFKALNTNIFEKMIFQSIFEKKKKRSFLLFIVQNPLQISKQLK